ncbi:MAG: hypothetical protein IIZ39_13750 [Blautia sp.]|nr:hypothetical protein [Blautia sp.]
MLPAFLIWSAIALLFFLIGIYCRGSKKPVGFFTGVKPPKMRDTSRYNRAVSKIWMISAILLELLGLPFLFLPQNSPVFILPLLGTIFLCLGMMIAYTLVEQRYRE